MKRSPSPATVAGIVSLGLLAVFDVFWARAAAQTEPPAPFVGATTRFHDMQVEKRSSGGCCSYREWNRLRDEKGNVLVERCGGRADSSCGLVAAIEADPSTGSPGRLVFLNANAPVGFLHALPAGTIDGPYDGHWSHDGRRILVCHKVPGGASSIQVLTFSADGRRAPKSETLQIPEGKTWEPKGIPSGLSAAPEKLELLWHGTSWSASDKSFVVCGWVEVAPAGARGDRFARVVYRCSADPPRLEEAVEVLKSILGDVDWSGEIPVSHPRK